jgi:pyruvate kinase
MTQFHFTKIIAGVGPILAKETVLSKIVNMVDIFRINLSQGFDDNNKKYVDTILKLDNSKTIMLETKGTDLRVKNVINIDLKKGDSILLEYSEYAQESDKKIYIDYPKLHELPKGTIVIFEQSDIQIEVAPGDDENLKGKVIKG